MAKVQEESEGGEARKGAKKASPKVPLASIFGRGMEVACKI